MGYVYLAIVYFEDKALKRFIIPEYEFNSYTDEEIENKTNFLPPQIFQEFELKENESHVGPINRIHILTKNSRADS